MDFYLLNAVVCHSSAGYFNSPLFTVLFTAKEQKRAIVIFTKRCGLVIICGESCIVLEGNLQIIIVPDICAILHFLKGNFEYTIKNSEFFKIVDALKCARNLAEKYKDKFHVLYRVNNSEVLRAE